MDAVVTSAVIGLVGLAALMSALLIWRSLPWVPRRLRAFMCGWLGWHSPARLWRPTGHDGCSAHAACGWCGYEGMVDSQGNLF